MFFWYFLNEWVSNDGERIIPKAWFSRHTQKIIPIIQENLCEMNLRWVRKIYCRFRKTVQEGVENDKREIYNSDFPLIFVLKKIKCDKSNFHEQFVLNLGELDLFWITIIYALLLVCFWWRNTLVNSCVPTVDGWKAASE